MAKVAKKPATRGRSAVLLPPLPMKFREALGDYLQVQPDTSAKPKRKARPSKRQPKTKAK